MTPDLSDYPPRIAEMIRTAPERWSCERHGEYVFRDGDTLQWSCPVCNAEASALEAAWKAAHELRDRHAQAQVPARHENRTLANWRPRTPADRRRLEAIRAWLAADGDDIGALVLCGPVGTGKTHLACACIAELVIGGWTAHYAPVPDFLAALRGAYDRNAHERPEDVLRPLDDAGVLVLDEIAATRGSDWEREVLAGLLDRRYRDGGRLIIATNAKPEELPLWIGARGADRLAEWGLVLQFAGTSYRATAATDPTLRAAAPAVQKPPRKLHIPITERGQLVTRVVTREHDGRFTTETRRS